MEWKGWPVAVKKARFAMKEILQMAVFLVRPCCISDAGQLRLGIGDSEKDVSYCSRL